MVGAHYFDADVATQIVASLHARVDAGPLPGGAEALATVLTEALQSVNGDQHLRVLFHADELPDHEVGDDAEELAAMAAWAHETCGGVASVRHLAGNIGYVDLQPILFPLAISAEVITAALSIVASTSALILDLRSCRGGDPELVTWLASYLFNEPVQLSSLDERRLGEVKHAWTLATVPGRRFGGDKPLFVLTSSVTFSGGEQLSYDLQQLGRATVVGEQTRGGAHAREGFRVDAHLEATISVARAVNPISRGNWEGTGVTPDVAVAGADALDVAAQLARRNRPAVRVCD